MCLFRKTQSEPQPVMSSAEKLAKRQEKYDEQLKEYGELLQLKRIVGTTRLNRINAANRLQRTENFCKVSISTILAILPF